MKNRVPIDLLMPHCLAWLIYFMTLGIVRCGVVFLNRETGEEFCIGPRPRGKE